MRRSGPATASPSRVDRSAPSADHNPVDPAGAALALHAVLRPVGNHDVAALASHRIRQAITLGLVPAGQRLPPERELARRLGIARTTLRDALQTLTKLGYIISRRGHGGGTFVTDRADMHVIDTPLGDQRTLDIDDTLTFQAALEPGVAELAARRTLDPPTRQRLAQQLHYATVATSPVASRFADARLHLVIAEITRSAPVIAAVADVQISLTDLWGVLPTVARNTQSSDHRVIVDAIIAGRPVAARVRMRWHIESTSTLLRRAVDEPTDASIRHRKGVDSSISS